MLGGGGGICLHLSTIGIQPEWGSRIVDCGVRMGLSTRAGGGAGRGRLSISVHHKYVVIVEFAKIPSIRRSAKGGETGENPYLGKKALKHIKLFPTL